MSTISWRFANRFMLLWLVAWSLVSPATVLGQDPEDVVEEEAGLDEVVNDRVCFPACAEPGGVRLLVGDREVGPAKPNPPAVDDEALAAKDVVRFVAINRLPLAFLIFVVGWVLLIIVSKALDDLGERLTERRLTLKKAKALLQFVSYLVIAMLMGGVALDIEGEVLFALLGTIGLAVGFALKDLLASLMAGVILLIDEPFQVGDRISFGNHYGEVSDIGLRSVRLVTLDDNLVTIPNSQFLTESVASANAGELDCMVVIPFYIGAAEDFSTARRIIHEVTATSRYVYLGKPVVTLVSDEFMGERFVTLVRVKAYVFDARYEKAFASDVTERVKRAFRIEGVRSPDTQYRDLDMYMQETAPDRIGPNQ